MRLIKSTKTTDNHKMYGKMSVCPDCDHQHPFPLNGRTHCEMCGAHGLVTSDVISCVKCGRTFTPDDYADHKEGCEV